MQLVITILIMVQLHFLSLGIYNLKVVETRNPSTVINKGGERKNICLLNRYSKYTRSTYFLKIFILNFSCLLNFKISYYAMNVNEIVLLLR